MDSPATARTLPLAGSQPVAYFAWRSLILCIERGEFGGEFGVNLLAVVVVVAEGGVDFGGGEVRILADDFLG